MILLCLCTSSLSIHTLTALFSPPSARTSNPCLQECAPSPWQNTTCKSSWSLPFLIRDLGMTEEEEKKAESEGWSSLSPRKLKCPIINTLIIITGAFFPELRQEASHSTALPSSWEISKGVLLNPFYRFENWGSKRLLSTWCHTGLGLRLTFSVLLQPPLSKSSEIILDLNDNIFIC